MVHRVDDDYPKDQVLAAFQGKDAVVCALNLTQIMKQISLIDVAVQAGVKWFIPTEYGGNKEATDKVGEPLPISHEAKKLVHEHLMSVESKGLSWTAVATGPFIDWYSMISILKWGTLC